MKRILLVAGGTGGHFFPAESLLEEFLEKNYNAHLITDNRCKQYISYPLITKIINVKKLSGTNFAKFIGLISLPISLCKSLYFLLRFKPDLLIGFGGYTSIPHLIGAFILNIPIAIHEQNSVMGKANLFFCKIAKLIMLSYRDTINFPSQYKSKSIFTGNFVRKKLSFTKNLFETHRQDIFTILILGGSQGAIAFSKDITNVIIDLSKTHKNIKVIQQVVEKDIEYVTQLYQENNINAEINSFFKDIDKKYTYSDLIVARAGASTIAEIVALAKPSVLIPLPSSSDNHQYFNAKLLSDKFASILLEQRNIKNDLAGILKRILDQPDELKRMTSSLKELQINGTQILFNSIEKLLL